MSSSVRDRIIILIISVVVWFVWRMVAVMIKENKEKKQKSDKDEKYNRDLPPDSSINGVHSLAPPNLSTFADPCGARKEASKLT